KLILDTLTHMGPRTHEQNTNPGLEMPCRYWEPLLRLPLPAQMVDATFAWSLLAGVDLPPDNLKVLIAHVESLK
ncbi:MAG: hypothetical protein WBR26_24360, partial [Candidatus Acidiferrum sp.]